MSLKVDGLWFWYKEGSPVLSDINFEVERGKTLFVLGPNGTGKTTLLKCLCGIKKPTKGFVSLDGKRIDSMRVHERAKKIGYVPQGNFDMFGTEAIDIIMMGKTAGLGRKMTADERDSVFETVEKIGLGHLAYKRINEMSGGERQYVFIARAIVQEPEIIVFDEPTAALDIKNQFEAMEFINSAAKKKNIGVVVSVHDISLAALFADEVMLLKSSRICDIGKPCEAITEKNIRTVYGIDVHVEEKYGGIQIMLEREKQ